MDEIGRVNTKGKLSKFTSYLLRDRLFLFLLVLWGSNDHIFKYTHPGLLTGKLSDITSLACAPIILFVTLWSIYLWFFGSASPSIKGARALMICCSLFMSMIMVGINLNENWAQAYRYGLGLAQWPFISIKYFISDHLFPPMPNVKLTMDPSDVWTAPCALLSLLIMRRAERALNASEE